MKIRIISACYASGVPQPVGTVLDLPRNEARDLIALRKAEVASESDSESEGETADEDSEEKPTQKRRGRKPKEEG